MEILRAVMGGDGRLVQAIIINQQRNYSSTDYR